MPCKATWGKFPHRQEAECTQDGAFIKVSVGKAKQGKGDSSRLVTLNDLGGL